MASLTLARPASRPGLVKAGVAAKKPAPQTSSGVQLIPSMAAVLRPSAAGNWLLPYLAAFTPQYVEMLIRGGLAGNHVQCHQLFDLMWDSDPEIQACIGEYRDGVSSKKIVIDPYHDEDEEPTDSAMQKAKLIGACFKAMRPDPAADENDIRGTVNDILAARFHGQSVLEVNYNDGWGSDGYNFKTFPGISGQVLCPRSTYWINPVCYAWDFYGRIGLRMPVDQIRQQTETIRQSKLAPIVDLSFTSTMTAQARPNMLAEFPANKFLIAIMKEKTGTPLGGSALRCLAWWWVVSNFCGEYLVKTAELFGVPFRTATYTTSTSPSEKNKIEQMLQSMGSTGYALLPEGAKIDFQTVTGTGAVSPQAYLMHLASEMKRKVILRQTMTGGVQTKGTGAGKGGMETESEVKDTCIQSGADYAASVLSLQLVPQILNLNYGDGGDLEAPTVRLVDNKVGGIVDAQRDVSLAQIMDIPEPYLQRKYDIPKPAKGEEVAGIDSGIIAEQADAAQKQQQQAAKIAQANAKALAQQQQQNPEGEEPTGAQAGSAARNLALQAAAGAKVKSLSELMAESVKPITDRLKAIADVDDDATRKTLLQKFLKDFPQIAKAVKRDDTFASGVTAQGVAAFVSTFKNRKT